MFDQFTIKISPGNSFFIWFYTEQYFWEVDYVYIQSHTPALAWKQLLKWLYSFLLLFSCIHLLVLGRWSFHWLFSLLKHIPSVQDVFWIWDGWQENFRLVYFFLCQVILIIFYNNSFLWVLGDFGMEIYLKNSVNSVISVCLYFLSRWYASVVFFQWLNFCIISP